MASFTVPYSDDQIDVDTARAAVLVFRNAWNRESSGIPDETHTFEELWADRDRLARLCAALTTSDAAELQRLVGLSDSD